MSARGRALGVLAATVGLLALFAALPISSALAATTVGQTGTPLPDRELSGGLELVQTDAAITAPGVVTSFQTESGTCNLGLQGIYDFQVLRPLGGGQYRVLGGTGNRTDPCDGQLHSYPVKIPVQTGDVIGVYLVKDWQGVLSSTSGSINADPIPEPTLCNAVTLTNQTTFTLDESATVVPAKNANGQQGQNTSCQGQDGNGQGQDGNH